MTGLPDPSSGLPLHSSLLRPPAGKLFHSGLPNKAINPIELCMEAFLEMQRRFYAEFPEHPEEAKWVAHLVFLL